MVQETAEVAVPAGDQQLPLSPSTSRKASSTGTFDVAPDLSDLVQYDFSFNVQFDKLASTLQSVFGAMTMLQQKNQELENEVRSCRQDLEQT